MLAAFERLITHVAADPQATAVVYFLDQVPRRTGDLQHPVVEKVLDLGDNFALCLAAGAAKGGGKVTDMGEVGAAQRRRLQQKLAMLQAEWDLRSEKLGRLRIAHAVEAGVAVAFQLEQQRLQEEAALAQLSDEIAALEQQLGG